MNTRRRYRAVLFAALASVAAFLVTDCRYSLDGGKTASEGSGAVSEPEDQGATAKEGQSKPRDPERDAAEVVRGADGAAAADSSGGSDRDGGAAVADEGKAEPEGRWRFAVLADSRDTVKGFNQAVFPLIVKAILKEHAKGAVDLILVPGDVVYGAADTRAEMLGWRKAMEPLYAAGMAVYPVRGNHELGCDADCWNDVFSGPYALPDDGPEGERGLTFSRLHKNALFIGFDNYGGNKVNLPWVQAVLKAQPRQHVFAFSHEPAFAAYHLDCLDDLPEQRDSLWASLKKAGSRAYFCGHDHFYDHARVDDNDGNPDNDIHQYIVGSAGGPLHSFSPPYGGNNSAMSVKQIDHAEVYGFVLAEIDGPRATLTWIALENGAGASWSYTAPP